MINRTVTQTTRPVSGPINLSDGKPEAKQAFALAGFTFAGLLIMSIGGLVIVISAPKEYGETLNAYRVIGMVFGGFTGLFAFIFAFTMGNVLVTEWQSYQKRRNAWHEAELKAFTDASGVETVNQYSQTELLPDVIKDVLIQALMIQYQLQRSNGNYRNAPWSIRSLEEKLYLDGSHNAVLIGELTGTRPEAMSERLATLGLVVNRKPGFAGEWRATSFDDVIATVARNWHRVGRT